MARFDPSSLFQLFILKGTSPLANHHHAFLQAPLTLQIYCSLRIDFLIIQNSNCCIMSDCHNGGKKAAKDCCVHWCVLVCSLSMWNTKIWIDYTTPMSFDFTVDFVKPRQLIWLSFRTTSRTSVHMLTMYDVWNFCFITLDIFKKRKRNQH